MNRTLKNILIGAACAVCTLGPAVAQYGSGYYVPSAAPIVESANTYALRNGVNGQTFNVYNTYTDAANYERGGLQWFGNILYLNTVSAGTGAPRSLYFSTNNIGRWGIDGSTGHILAATDNTYDFGQSGASRVRNIYAGTGIFTAAAGQLGWAASTTLTAPSNGVLGVRDSSATNSFTITAGASNLATFNGGITTGGAITVTSGSVATNAGNINAGFSLIAGTAVFPTGASLGRIASPGDGAIITSRHDGTIPTVSQLAGLCTSGNDGARSFVTDATATTFASSVAGGGSNHVPVYCDGSGTPAWKIG